MPFGEQFSLMALLTHGIAHFSRVLVNALEGDHGVIIVDHVAFARAMTGLTTRVCKRTAWILGLTMLSVHDLIKMITMTSGAGLGPNVGARFFKKLIKLSNAFRLSNG